MTFVFMLFGMVDCQVVLLPIQLCVKQKHEENMTLKLLTKKNLALLA